MASHLPKHAIVVVNCFDYFVVVASITRNPFLQQAYSNKLRSGQSGMF